MFIIFIIAAIQFKEKRGHDGLNETKLRSYVGWVVLFLEVVNFNNRVDQSLI